MLMVMWFFPNAGWKWSAGKGSATHNAVLAVHDGDGLLKLLSLFAFELAKLFSDLVDQTADAADLFV
ncbi:hypothetical protein [Mycobacterium lepromatosis]|uniref:hypothetical protein n=1 Tax=Mycobacterium lepromatosis TaxID=480418 RepID=UPI001EDAF5C2|nr:hypothetical protein [Mycobacterium lepromatosis]